MNLLKNTILMIEDDLSIYKLFTYILKRAGFAVVLFSKGAEACNWAKENVPAIVLCDIMLPDMNGEEVMETIRTIPEYKELPILAVTALARKGDKERFISKGFTDYYAKPINTTTFALEIKKHIKV
jgi:CheY-like chemotaxis protein